LASRLGALIALVVQVSLEFLSLLQEDHSLVLVTILEFATHSIEFIILTLELLNPRIIGSGGVFSGGDLSLEIGVLLPLVVQLTLELPSLLCSIGSRVCELLRKSSGSVALNM
jgi:hypothetical protein